MSTPSGRPRRPTGRVLPDPDPGRPAGRAGLLRGDHPRQSRRRPPRPRLADLRPQGHPQGKARHAGPVPHPRHHRRRRPQPARRLQALEDQAVPPARQGPQNGNHDQRHQRLRRAQRAVSPPRTEGDRLHRQPAPARRPTDQPRPRRGGGLAGPLGNPVTSPAGTRTAGCPSPARECRRCCQHCAPSGSCPPGSQVSPYPLEVSSALPGPPSGGSCRYLPRTHDHPAGATAPHMLLRPSRTARRRWPGRGHGP